MQRERKKENRIACLLASIWIEKEIHALSAFLFLVEKRTASGVAEAAAKSKAA